MKRLKFVFSVPAKPWYPSFVLADTESLILDGKISSVKEEIEVEIQRLNEERSILTTEQSEILGNVRDAANLPDHDFRSYNECGDKIQIIEDRLEWLNEIRTLIKRRLL